MQKDMKNVLSEKDLEQVAGGRGIWGSLLVIEELRSLTKKGAEKKDEAQLLTTKPTSIPF